VNILEKRVGANRGECLKRVVDPVDLVIFFQVLVKSADGRKEDDGVGIFKEGGPSVTLPPRPSDIEKSPSDCFLANANRKFILSHA